MAEPVIRLGVDIGSAYTKAIVATPARLTVMPDGTPRMRSGVFVDPDGHNLLIGSAARAAAVERPDLYLADPTALVAAKHAQVGERTVTAAEVYAAILQVLRSEASHLAGHLVTSVAITVPPSWGRIRRDILREAASLAGFTDTHLVASPTAALAHVTATTPTTIPTGGAVLVVDAGAAQMTLTVLEQTDSGPVQTATQPVPGTGGDNIDRRIAEHLLATATAADPASLPPDDPHWREVLSSAQDAKIALAERARTSLLLPDPNPPVALDRADLATIVEPALTAVAQTVTDVLDAADLTTAHLTTVVLTGGSAPLPGLQHTLATATGHPVVVPARGDLAAADGAVTATSGAEPQPSGPVAIPRVRLKAHDLIRPAILGAASLALLTFVFVTMWTTTATAGIDYVFLPAELISAAAAIAVLTAWSVAQLLPTLYLAADNVDRRQATALISASYTGAATIGLAVAAIYGLTVGALVGTLNTEYLPHALTAATPIAAAALLVAALARAIPAEAIPGWLAQQRHPVHALVLATAGILAMRYAVSASIDQGLAALIIRTGTALTGIAIAITIVTSPRLRVVTATILAIGGATVASLGNNRPTTLAYVAAITWWALVRVAATARAAYPSLQTRARQLLAQRTS